MQARHGVGLDCPDAKLNMPRKDEGVFPGWMSPVLGEGHSIKHSSRLKLHVVLGGGRDGGGEWRQERIILKGVIREGLYPKVHPLELDGSCQALASTMLQINCPKLLWTRLDSVSSVSSDAKRIIANKRWWPILLITYHNFILTLFLVIHTVYS